MAILKIECPDEILVSLKESREDFVSELKIAAAVKLYEVGRLSSGKAAKLAGLGKVSFLKTLGTYKISISTLKEFQKDLKIVIK